VIRTATVDDARAIAAVHVSGWQAAYREYFPADFLDGLSVERRAEQWAAWLADAAQTTAVYETPAGIVGFATIGPSRDADADPSVGELMSIYVAPAAWRRGVGTELMSWVTAEAAARHWSALTLWTIEANRGTRAFYERCGWAHDGSAKRERFAGQMLSQVRYAWRLSVSDSDRVLASGDT
jgi:GNAT superfamily N-acetyltransferase